MDISLYTSYFHDGEVLGIAHEIDNIVMTLKSAEIDPKRVENVSLSTDNRLEGKLHIQGVKLVLNNGKKFKGKIRMFMPDNDLLHLKIKGGIVFCEIGWRGQNSGEVDFSDFEIHASKIWWEPLPSRS